MKVTFRDKKWQFTSIILAVSLAISLAFNIYQAFNGSNNASSGTVNTRNTPMNFTFTWGPNAQDIVNETFKIDVSVWFTNCTSPWDNTTTEIFSILIGVYDDDYSSDDFLGLVLDENHNGIIDYGTADRPHLLYARNTTTKAGLSYDGLLGPAEVPETNLYACTYDPEKGYVFHYEALKSNITTTIGSFTYIPIHVCFWDANVCSPCIGTVAVQFRIFL